MFNMIHIRDSDWRTLGATLSVLGIIFLAAGAGAYAGNFRDYVAVLIVFGGICTVIGAGLVTITLFERKQADAAEETTTDA